MLRRGKAGAKACENTKGHDRALDNAEFPEQLFSEHP
jgi:hypothetical protein